MISLRFGRALPRIMIPVIALLGVCCESGCSTASSPTTAASLPTLTGTDYPLSGVFPAGGIAVGSDGNLWFSFCPQALGAMTKITTSGQMSSFALPAGLVRCPQWVVRGSDGAIWFTELDINQSYPLAQLGRIDIYGNITEFALPAGDQPIGISSGRDGNLWYDAFGVSNSNPIYIRGFSPATHTIVGSVSINLVSPNLSDAFNSVVTNPSDGNVIVSGGNPVFRVIPGTTPTIAGNIMLPTNCENPNAVASIGTDRNIYFQCANSIFARVSQSSYSVTTVLERLTYKGEATYSGPMFQGSNGILYTSGGYGLENGPFTDILGLNSDGTVMGDYPSDMHDQAVQGVVGPDGATWVTIENGEGRDAVLSRINP
jgi:hypothetical protein